MNRGDIKQAIDRCNAHDLPDAADLIASLADRLALWQESAAEKEKVIQRVVTRAESLEEQLGTAQADSRKRAMSKLDELQKELSPARDECGYIITQSRWDKTVANSSALLVLRKELGAALAAIKQTPEKPDLCQEDES